jgi:predicted nucleic acid-binding protein
VAAEAGLVLLVLSTAITSELREKLIEKFGVPAAETEAVIDRLKARAEHVSTPGRSGWVTLDPDDDKFIDAALTAGATIIVSGDRHLLDLGTVEGIEIVTARQFLDRLPAIGEDTDSTTH